MPVTMLCFLSFFNIFNRVTVKKALKTQQQDNIKCKV